MSNYIGYPNSTGNTNFEYVLELITNHQTGGEMHPGPGPELAMPRPGLALSAGRANQQTMAKLHSLMRGEIGTGAPTKKFGMSRGSPSCQ